MKMKCTEDADLGNKVEIRFDLQYDDDDYQVMPEIFVDLSDFPMEDDDGDSAYLFSVPFFELLMDGVQSADEAEIYVEWLRSWADEICRRFKIKKRKLPGKLTWA